MNKDMLVLGMDIGGTNFRLGLVDTDLNVSDVKILPSSLITSTDSTPNSICRVLKEYLDGVGDKKERVAIIASGWPSLVDKSRRVLMSSTNFPGVDGVDIVSTLEENMHLPVLIEHDAYYLLRNDINKHNVPLDGAILGFYFGTGMGNAIFIDGKEFIGNHGAASEIGHMPFGLGDRECTCGNYGCVEMYSCGKAFERLCKESFPTTPIADIYLSHPDSPLLDEFVRSMAVPVATEINILDPSYVFIGGGLTYMKCFPKEKLKSYIMKNVRRPYPYDGVNIIFSENSPNNGIIGAALSGFKELGL